MNSTDDRMRRLTKRLDTAVQRIENLERCYASVNQRYAETLMEITGLRAALNGARDRVET